MITGLPNITIPIITQKCSDCRLLKDPIEYISKDKKYLTCNSCRERRNRYNSVKQQNKCRVCGIMACYNFEGEKVGICCKKHMEVGMIDINHYKCVICNKKRRNFGFNGKPTHCADCKEDGMLNCVSKMCVVCEKKVANFNKPNEENATHCGSCKESGMIDVKNRKCVICKKKRPNFGKLNTTKPTHCADCKDSDMVDVKTKLKCIICKNKQPSFGIFEDGVYSKSTHCKDCKEPGMVNCKDKKCVVCNKKIPVFNKPGETKATHCSDCRDLDMVDVINKKCATCKLKQPHFNKPGETKKLFCSDCKQPGMIMVTTKKCSICEKNTAVYGYIGQLKTHCTHCARNLKYVGLYQKTNTICEDDCKELATYGVKDPIHCEEHAKDNEICLIVKKCKGCSRDNMLLDKNDLCITYCRPNDIYQQQKREKKKENMVLNYLNNFIKPSQGIQVIDNECLAIELKDCNRRLPDRAYDCGTHFVIVEVDENQHKDKGYTKEDNCELARMHQIYEVVGLPCIFLRFNPDNYRVKTKLQKVNMSQRLDILGKWVEKCIKMVDTQGILYKFLYYDEYIETDLSFNVLDDLLLVK